MRFIITCILCIALCVVPSYSLCGDTSVEKPSEIYCLAITLYNEARGETTKGQQAVASVVFNRSKLTNKTICDTIFSPYQFSWHGKKSMPTYEELQYVLPLSYDLYQRHRQGRHKDITNGATHFCHKKIKNKWTKKYKRTLIVNNHVFYRGEYK